MTINTMRLLALAALLSGAAACADAGVTEPAAAAAGPSQVAVAAPACVKFGPMPPVGTQWGAPAGHVPGSLVHTEATINVTTHNFFHPGGGFSFDRVRLEPALAVGIGSGNVAHFINLSLRFNFMAAGGWQPNLIRFRYLDLGGHENIAINGALFIGDMSVWPAFLGGANITVFPTYVEITGPVNTLQIGGQEWFVDDLCAWP
jgi:hypothetical protein